MTFQIGAWVRWRGGQAAYAGRITRPPFAAWSETPEAKLVIAAAASRIRFSLIGRTRAARRHLWRQLSAAARDAGVVAAIQTEVQRYLETLSVLAYANGLPRVFVDLRRLVVVPRVLLNGAAYKSLETRLSGQPAFASMDGGGPLREFFLMRLIQEIETAVAIAQPSVSHPLSAGDGWVTVGLNAGFTWRLPMLQQSSWDGHHYVLELRKAPITRAVRKAIVASMEGLERSLPGLSRRERNEVLRQTVYSD
jgi:hypothetical protein